MAGKLDQSAAKLNSGDSSTDPPALRVLKVLVVVMGILIVAGVVTVVATIVSRLSGGTKEAAAPVSSAPISVPFGEIAHALPDEARVVSVSAGSGRLYIHYETAGGLARVLVLDGATGAELGKIHLEQVK
jgi:hypothetical protein